MTSEKWQQIVKFVALANILLEVSDTISDTPIVKQALKNKINGLVKELDRSVIKYVERLYDTDEELFQQIQISMEYLIDSHIVDVIKKAKQNGESKTEV